VPYIDLPGERPGILGLFAYRPETARPLMELTEVLLRGESALTRGERELIATYVSALNECHYFTLTHAAKAAAQLPAGIPAALDSPKLKTLLRIAAAVRESGRAVTRQFVAEARAAGATDEEIHDTVLIAAAYCMFNRYVDGLDAPLPDDEDTYTRLAEAEMERGHQAAADAA
jgi:uncharacterized peroxidase-related enzyme